MFPLHQDGPNKDIGHWMCLPSEETDELVAMLLHLLTMLLYSALPALLLVLLNGLLAHVLYASRRALLSHADSARHVGGRGGSVRTR